MNPTADSIVPAPCPKCGGTGWKTAPGMRPGTHSETPCDCRPAAWKCHLCGGERDYCRCNDDCRPAAPAEPLLKRIDDVLSDVSQLLDGWHADGTAWSEWDESVRKKVGEVHKAVFLEIRPPADRGRGETDLAGQRAEVLLCKWADARDRLDELSRTPIPWGKRDAVREKMQKIHPHFDAAIAARDAATAEVGRLRAELADYWSKTSRDAQILDDMQRRAARAEPERDDAFRRGRLDALEGRDKLAASLLGPEPEFIQVIEPVGRSGLGQPTVEADPVSILDAVREIRLLRASLAESRADVAALIPAAQAWFAGQNVLIDPVSGNWYPIAAAARAALDRHTPPG